MRTDLADGALNGVEGIDVAGAFPEQAEVRVTNQSCIGPVFNIAVAAARFHGAGGHRDIVAAGPELDDRGEHSEHLLVVFIAAGQLAHARRIQQGRQGLLGRHHQFEKLATHQRMLDNRFAKGIAMLAGHHGFVQAAAHHARRPGQVRNAA